MKEDAEGERGVKDESDSRFQIYVMGWIAISFFEIMNIGRRVYWG